MNLDNVKEERDFEFILPNPYQDEKIKKWYWYDECNIRSKKSYDTVEEAKKALDYYVKYLLKDVEQDVIKSFNDAMGYNKEKRVKYVMIDYSIPILFSEAHGHSDFKHLGNITSAGYVRIYPETNGIDYKIGVECYGFSESLLMQPDPENDEKIIKKLLNGE